MNSDAVRFRVSIPAQTVDVLRGGAVLWTAPVSTSAFGCGETPDSLQTPRGLHEVAEKIGAGSPLGTVFKSRQPTGEVWTPAGQPTEDDLVLTRILWLRGCEPSNQTSQGRYIYFHGTNHENQIGTPGSHGCIRLRNADIVILFDYAHVGTPVEIWE
jgi:L,D-transpeptidase YbiS